MEITKGKPLVAAYLYCEDGYSWDDGGYDTRLSPLEAVPLSFIRNVEEVVSTFVGSHRDRLEKEVNYRLLLEFRCDVDLNGAILSGWYEVIKADYYEWM